MFTKSYCYNLGISSDEVQQIWNDFYAHSENVAVYKANGSIYAEFSAGSEIEVNRCIEEACSIINFYYPKLSLAGASFEEEPA